MKTTTVILTLTGLLAFSAAKADTNAFKSDLERNSYAIGVNYGTAWKQQDLEVDFDALLNGLKDSFAGKAKLTEQETRETLNKLSTDMRAKYAEKQKKVAEKNKTDGEAFLAANKSKPGVITLPNGLQYKVIAEGSGESPKAEDTVDVNYRGTLIDGTEFDSNSKPGQPTQPFTTPVSRVIKGWTEALTRMKPGAKWQLFIPADLAYGERPAGPKIGPNSALIFDVELLSIKPAPVVTNAPGAPGAPAQPLTSDIIKVPSLEEMKKGAKIETIPADQVEKLQKQAEEEKKKQQQPK